VLPLVVLQIPGNDSLVQAAEFRRQLYQLGEQHLQRAAPTCCELCKEDLEALVPTSGKAGSKLLLLACLHGFHHHCWVEQQADKEGMCPCCKVATPAINL
jgi:hypothetical protein